jgi:hypothetical protein
MMKSTLLLLSLGAFSACADDAMTAKGVDPDTAPVASVDRFSDGFAHLFKRSGPAFDPANVQPIVPAPNAPIDFDTYFTVRALGPAGEDIRYYSLDIVPKVPATGYVVVSAGTPVPDQLDIIDKLPGEAGYNDFVRITEVEVGKGYVANTMTSAADLVAAVAAGNATMTMTTKIANWSAVPRGTVATKKFHGRTITGHRVWVKGEVANILLFESATQDTLLVTGASEVPTSPIIVIFHDNASPAQGFEAESSGKTHNAIATLPGDPDYSSLWDHSVGDKAGFTSVTNYATALSNVMAANVGVDVNCPVIE